MRNKVLNRVLRTDAIAATVVIIALLGALVASVLVLTRPDRPKGAGPSAPRFDARVEKELEATLEGLMSRDEIPGAIVGIWVPGRGTWVVARGVSNLENNTPMKVNDRVRIASITKTFVATVVLQLVDEGRLSLDDTIDRFVTRVPNGDAITIRQLLNHTSGLYDFIFDPVFQAACAADPLEKWTPRQLLSSSVLHDPYFAPGAGFRYSNTNYVLLGMVVEKLTGRGIGTEISRRVLEPLSLDNTTFETDPEITEPASRGYTEEYGRPVDITRRDPSMGWASSGMSSNLEDLRVWSLAFANGGLISEESEIEQADLVNDPNSEVKYGAGLMEWGGFVGHEGNAFGFSTAMFHLPSKNATIVVIFNRSGVKVTATYAFTEFARVLFGSEVPSRLELPR